MCNTGALIIIFGVVNWVPVIEFVAAPQEELLHFAVLQVMIVHSQLAICGHGRPRPNLTTPENLYLMIHVSSDLILPSSWSVYVQRFPPLALAGASFNLEMMRHLFPQLRIIEMAKAFHLWQRPCRRYFIQYTLVLANLVATNLSCTPTSVKVSRETMVLTSVGSISLLNGFLGYRLLRCQIYLVY